MREKQIERALAELKRAVQDDSYDLTREDQDAILLRIQQLEEFINGVYSDRKRRLD